MCDICDASDDYLESAYEDQFLADRDYVEEEDNWNIDHEEDENLNWDEQSHQARMEQIQDEIRNIWPDEPETDNPDDYIGIGTFEDDPAKI